jgi:hypothetical protein
MIVRGYGMNLVIDGRDAGAEVSAPALPEREESEHDDSIASGTRAIR